MSVCVFLRDSGDGIQGGGGWHCPAAAGTCWSLKGHGEFSKQWHRWAACERSYMVRIRNLSHTEVMGCLETVTRCAPASTSTRSVAKSSEFQQTKIFFYSDLTEIKTGRGGHKIVKVPAWAELPGLCHFTVQEALDLIFQDEEADRDLTEYVSVQEDIMKMTAGDLTSTSCFRQDGSGKCRLNDFRTHMTFYFPCIWHFVNIVW